MLAADTDNVEIGRRPMLVFGDWGFSTTLFTTDCPSSGSLRPRRSLDVGQEDAWPDTGDVDYSPRIASPASSSYSAEMSWPV